MEKKQIIDTTVAPPANAAASKDLVQEEAAAQNAADNAVNAVAVGD